MASLKKNANGLKTPVDLATQAQIHINAGRFKEAIDLYKRLLQAEPVIEHKKQLAHCYLQRALALAGKGMTKEAVVLWENYRQHAKPPYAGYDRYLYWLLQSRQSAKLAPLLAKLQAAQLDNESPALAEPLGLALLDGQPELAGRLPQDSAFSEQLATIKSAIKAFSAEQPEQAEQLLKTLPYRSAFRHCRALLKAALLLPQNPYEAAALAQKIPDDSSYAPAASLLQTLTLKGAALVKQMLKLTVPERKFVTEMLDLNPDQCALVDHLAIHKDRLDDKTTFNLALRFRSVFGAEAVKNFCTAMLATYPTGQRDFEKVFGALDEFSRNRLKALNLEHKEDYHSAAFYWRHCIRELRHEDAVRQALIVPVLKHMAAHQTGRELLDTCQEILTYAPHDKECYRRILAYYKAKADEARYREWCERALALFPGDAELLTEAIQAAAASKNVKLTEHYAQALLQVDPLNTTAKHELFKRHLASARTLLGNKDYPSAAAEIAQADKLKTGKNKAAALTILRHLLHYAHENKNEGLKRIAEWAAKTHQSSPYSAHFQVVMEVLLSGLPAASILRALPALTEYSLTPADLQQLLESIRFYTDQAIPLPILHKGLDKLKAALKKAIAGGSFEESLLLTYCQILVDIEQFELLRHCTKAASPKWLSPLWLYYLVYAKTTGNPARCNMFDRMRLEMVLAEARDTQDHRAAVLLENYLHRYDESTDSTSKALNPFLPLANSPTDDDPFAALFDPLPDDLFYRIDKKADQLLKKTAPEKLLKNFGFTGRQEQTLFGAIMNNPDLLTALVYFKAAQTLNIDIGFSVNDLLSRFNVDID